MPANLKRLVRARMAETGESYQAALRHVRARARPDEEYHCDVCGAPVDEPGGHCDACEDADEHDRRLHEQAHGPVRLG